MAIPELKRLQASTPRFRRFNVTEYYQMAKAGILKPDDRVELLEGEIITMSSIGSQHAVCVRRLNKLLIGLVGDQGVVDVQNPIHLDDFTEPQPDLTVSKPRADLYAAHHPTPADVLLVIEVADTTLRFDQNVKTRLYAKAGIPEVWIVDIAHEQIIGYTDPSGRKYETIQFYTRGEPVASEKVPVVTIAVNDILG